MSIYTIISSPEDLQGAPRASTCTLEDEVIWEGTEAGIFSNVIPLSTGRGALVEIDAESESEARFLLDSLTYIKADMVCAELALAA